MEAPDLGEIADQPEGFERLPGRRSLAAIHSCINRRLGQAYPLVGCTHSLAYFLRTSIGPSLLHTCGSEDAHTTDVASRSNAVPAQHT